MQRVFITGASGFLGRYLLKQAPGGMQILAQYHHNPIPSTAPGLEMLPVDLTNPDWKEVLDFQPGAIIHTAALSLLDECEREPLLAEEINYHATVQLAEIARRTKARFIFVSTDQLFDGKKSLYSEGDPPIPLSVYGKTKAAAEKYLLAHLNNCVVARAALIYGKALHGKPTFTETMVNKLGNGQPVKLFVDEYRTPVLVQNLAAALWELAGSDFRGIIHLGGAQRVSRYEMGEILCRLFDFSTGLLIPTRLAELALPAPRPPDCSLDISLAKRTLHTRMVDCEEGLRLAFGR